MCLLQSTTRRLIQSARFRFDFLVPGKRETLRISGRAEVVRDAPLLESMAANGKVPAPLEAVEAVISDDEERRLY